MQYSPQLLFIIHRMQKKIFSDILIGSPWLKLQCNPMHVGLASDLTMELMVHIVYYKAYMFRTNIEFRILRKDGGCHHKMAAKRCGTHHKMAASSIMQEVLMNIIWLGLTPCQPPYTHPLRFENVVPLD